MLRDPDFIMPRTTSIKLSGLPSSLSSICFAFGGNIVWPDVERGMKKRKSFPKVLSLANLLVAIMYLAMAAAGYALFGDENVQSPITISFGKNLRTNANNISDKRARVMYRPQTFWSSKMDHVSYTNSPLYLYSSFGRVGRFLALLRAPGQFVGFCRFGGLNFHHSSRPIHENVRDPCQVHHF
ncbi:hypothetical protein AX774_g6968 [Zancudomyces culisetae]|uniref:Amino acid transporter transmembrane domain-containing protein n=1 Tax=Zancudomyces culisetae TaxID=1213189 RepID=A0A1R1PF90_ZANCU|nr:hypothetical protein AX774_g6968 [Zancudomyces culisetae]|eukprot:OMH79616.1 hypothetical protein AX774_g6968 [Zancudomyces culisetae]